VSILTDDVRHRPDDGVGPTASTLPRLLAGIGAGDRPVALADHRRRYAAPPLPRRAREDVLAIVERSGLRGRGGAGFPTSAKLRAVAAGRAPVVVVNGCEGEPASAKDRLLLTAAPHLVLDGALLAAVAVGAADVVVAVPRNAANTVRTLEWALAERRSGAGSPAEAMPSVRVVGVPDRYVAGEASALVQWLNGGPAKPTGARSRPSAVGVEGRPTLVDNAETVAHLAQIVRWGPEWFRQVGTALEPGTMLVTASGAVTRRGVCEVPLGTPLAEVVTSAGGDPALAPAVLVGGYFGSWVDLRSDPGRLLSDADLAHVGGGVGCGALVVLPEGSCGLRTTTAILDWLAGESAGQCGVCVNGLPAIARDMAALAAGGSGAGTVDRLRRWADQVDGRGACRLPDGAVRLLRSALRVFAADVERHARWDGCRGAPAPLYLPATSGGPWR
jgi:NADH:ubiquinone oxidoreductase subunit F (NADH-binding)